MKKMSYYINENGTKVFVSNSDMNSKDLTEAINRSREVAALKNNSTKETGESRMNITFLLGNGFDIGLGLNTRYENYYDEYCKINDKDDKNIKEFKETLIKWREEREKEVVDWADFERAFGEHSADLSDKSLYLERFKHFIKGFNLYLEKEYTNLEFSNTEQIAEMMHGAMSTYYNLREGDKVVIDNVYSSFRNERKRYNFISFNYTKAVDRCVEIFKDSYKNLKEYELGEVAHVHGYIEKNMILGVNDAKQIINTDFAKDPDILRYIVKPQQNAEAKTMYDERVTRIIMESNIICTYGMSIGVTDKKWWNLISNWLANGTNRRLIILAHDEGYNERFPFAQFDVVDKYVNRFLRNSNLSEDVKQKIKGQIHVGVNNDVFSMNLRKQEEIEINPEELLALL